jgi:hypothetical protein
MRMSNEKPPVAAFFIGWLRPLQLHAGSGVQRGLYRQAGLGS